MTDLSITIKGNDLIVKDGDKFLVSKEGEDALLRFYQLKKRVEEAEEKLKELLKKKINEEKITKVEGEKVKIIKRYFGSRYKIVDKELAKQKGYGKVKEIITPDNELIETILEEEGKLPEGVEINDKRQEQIVISLVDNKNED